MRIGTLALRHDDFDLIDEAIVLQCLMIGRPYVNSEILKCW